MGMKTEKELKADEEQFLAYTAGFFDADGTVGIYWNKRNGYFLLTGTIVQSLWMPIFQDWQDRWGGWFYYYSGRKGNSWQWKTGSDGTAQFLKDILPWLRKKQDQAELAIKFQESRKKETYISGAQLEWQRAISDALKQMKRISEPAPAQLLERVKDQVAALYRQLELFSLEEAQEREED